MSGAAAVGSYIELSLDPIRFDPVSKVTNVFFDDANRQIFAVRSGGATGVVVRGPDEKTSHNFRMEDKGHVISIKFSPDQNVLAIQRSSKSVEFVNFADGIDVLEYSQGCKGKTTQILGFNWTSCSDIVFITDHGIEYYQIMPEKRTLKSVKTFSVTVNWFIFMPEAGVLLLSSGALGNIIHPYLFTAGFVSRLPKFEVDLPIIPKPAKLCLLERDVTMATIYGQVYIIVLRHQPRSAGHMGAEVALYQIYRESPARKTDVLKLEMSGRFAVNVVDNIVVVHHQASKTSMLFDIRDECENDGFVNYHHPLLPALPIKPFTLQLPVVSAQVSGESSIITCELYSPNWVVFQPDIIIDAKLGCLWHMQLSLEPMVQLFPDKRRLVDMLLRRHNSKMAVVGVCQQLLLATLPPPHSGTGSSSSVEKRGTLATIAKVFDRMNAKYKTWLDADGGQAAAAVTSPNSSDMPSSPASGCGDVTVVVDQSDLYTHVLSVFVEDKENPYKFVIAVLIEYIRSLNQFRIPVQHYLYELVINTLVHHNCFYQLHQFLQYHVLSDSKPLACLMLSLENVYQPAYQLALDMLKRLTTANEEIVEVLLSKQQLLPAIRFVRSVGSVDNISARKFLEAAMATNDDLLFFTVFKFFEHRNVRLRGSTAFPKGEHCEPYVQHFEKVFGAEALGIPASA